MFPDNPFHSKHPVVAELEEVFQVSSRELFLGCTMITLPPHPQRHLTVSEVIAATPRLQMNPDEDNEAPDKTDDEDPSEEICPACSGSGEGAYDGTSCGTCHPRRGSRGNGGNFEEPDEPDFPDNYEG